MKTFKQFFVDEVSENFMDGRNPQDKGDMARHGLKNKTIAQLKKVRGSDSASPRKKQLAHFYIIKKDFFHKIFQTLQFFRVFLKKVIR